MESRIDLRPGAPDQRGEGVAGFGKGLAACLGEYRENVRSINDASSSGFFAAIMGAILTATAVHLLTPVSLSRGAAWELIVMRVAIVGMWALPFVEWIVLQIAARVHGHRMSTARAWAIVSHASFGLFWGGGVSLVTALVVRSFGTVHMTIVWVVLPPLVLFEFIAFRTFRALRFLALSPPKSAGIAGRTESR